jgi:hypothetical protein
MTKRLRGLDEDSFESELWDDRPSKRTGSVFFTEMIKLFGNKSSVQHFDTEEKKVDWILSSLDKDEDFRQALLHPEQVGKKIKKNLHLKYDYKPFADQGMTELQANAAFARDGNYDHITPVRSWDQLKTAKDPNLIRFALEKGWVRMEHNYAFLESLASRKLLSAVLYLVNKDLLKKCAKMIVHYDDVKAFDAYIKLPMYHRFMWKEGVYIYHFKSIRMLDRVRAEFDIIEKQSQEQISRHLHCIQNLSIFEWVLKERIVDPVLYAHHYLLYNQSRLLKTKCVLYAFYVGWPSLVESDMNTVDMNKRIRLVNMQPWGLLIKAKQRGRLKPTTQIIDSIPTYLAFLR